jgi:hypothetical protein
MKKILPTLSFSITLALFVSSGYFLFSIPGIGTLFGIILVLVCGLASAAALLEIGLSRLIARNCLSNLSNRATEDNEQTFELTPAIAAAE